MPRQAKGALIWPESNLTLHSQTRQGALFMWRRLRKHGKDKKAGLVKTEDLGVIFVEIKKIFYNSR